MKPSDRKVAVVTTHYRERLTPEEQVSLAHLRRHLSAYDNYLVLPEGLTPCFACDGMHRIDFPREYFRDKISYSRLLLSESFYERFAAYSHILTYQMDCLVFSSDLSPWLEADYDYLGAPWFTRRSRPQLPEFLCVGNGGFSLRRVSSCLEVLRSSRPHFWPLSGIPFGKHTPMLFLLHNLLILARHPRPLRFFCGHFRGHEDYFWSCLARLAKPGFRIPDCETALKFSFERFPAFLHNLNDGRLPFGCHAWPVFDRHFWAPYLLPPDQG